MSSRILGYLAVDEKGRTTIPKRIREALGLSEGTRLRVDRASDGTFELVPSEVIPHDQLWFHSAEIRSRITKAEADFRDGRSVRTSDPDETRRYLDSLAEKTESRRTRPR